MLWQCPVCKLGPLNVNGPVVHQCRTYQVPRITRPADLPPCVYRGDVVGSHPCPSCGDDPLAVIDVHECQLHGRCAVKYWTRRGDDIAAAGETICISCQDWTTADGSTPIKEARANAEALLAGKPCCEPPSLIAKACTLAKATAKHALDGFALLPVTAVEARYRVCETCPYVAGDKASCNACGCRVSAQAVQTNKAAWRSEDCPKGFWPANEKPPAPS